MKFLKGVYIYKKKYNLLLLHLLTFELSSFAVVLAVVDVFHFYSTDSLFYPPDSTQNSVFAFAFSYSFIKYKKRFLKTNTISTTLSVDAEQRICSLFFAKEIEMKNGGMKMHFNHISSLGLT